MPQAPPTGRSSRLPPMPPLRHDSSKGTREMIGFATLPEQVHRKTVKRGFEFTLLVVGEAGLGKSTLVNSLFLTELYKDRKNPPVHGAIKKTVEIEKKTVEIEEKGVKLRLTVVDTPGFGDGVDCGDDWKSVERYVDEQFNKYFQDESGLNRRNIQDHRVHCCLYFVPPYGHGLRQLDVEFMKRLHRKVNIVPVVAKADTLTKAEIAKLKANLLRDIDTHKIKIYQFPDCDEDEDEEFQQQDRELKASIPFAVIGSNCIIEIAGRRVRGRQYPWGIVEVENAAHCDFVKLRTMLISTHMQDMKEVTQDIHYENFRAQCISHMNQVALKERSKLRRDSISAADVKRPVDDPGKLLEQKDEEIRRMQEMLSQMQQRLQGQHDPLNKLPPAKPPKPSAPSSLNKTPQGSSSRDSIINV
ncbi:septin-5-like isoform X1 [Hyalella azteca]|uniref:Septin n=2 Tax=Hyalella azteca TaxID=294128 RepID=A0A8B7NX10_HYAAZ|nr:septin-5-like isoform X1 [Hyalella azteca]